MPNTMPSIEVQAGAPTPYPFGLFSIAPLPIPADIDRRWEAGVWWQTAGCQQVGVTHAPCTVDSAVPALDPNVLCGIATAEPFTVYARSDRSMGGQPVAERFAQARANLLSGEQYAVEQAMWALLTAATVAATGTAATVAEGIAMADGYMPSVYGGTPVIHLPRYSAAMAADSSALRVSGSNLTTFLGSPVVAGGGYLPRPIATKPASDVIATGRVVILRGEVFDLGEHFDQQTNQLSAVVERTYVIGWDCTAIRVHVNALP